MLQMRDESYRATVQSVHNMKYSCGRVIKALHINEIS